MPGGVERASRARLSAAVPPVGAPEPAGALPGAGALGKAGRAPVGGNELAYDGGSGEGTDGPLEYEEGGAGGESPVDGLEP